MKNVYINRGVKLFNMFPYIILKQLVTINFLNLELKNCIGILAILFDGSCYNILYNTYT